MHPPDVPTAHDGPGELRPCADTRPADWLGERLTGTRWATVASMCTQDYEAYARILHPTWHDPDGSGDDDELRPVTWGRIAEANGYRLHPEIRFEEIVRVGGETLISQPGLWEYGPSNAGPPSEICAPLTDILARHTRTPRQCWFALWDGYGVMRDLIPQGAPRAILPGRDKLLFQGPLAALRDDEPPLRVQFDHWWPQDRAWCLGADVDLWSSYLGGSEECIAEIVACPELEAFRIGPDQKIF
ncbi:MULTISPECIES: hypothetical protein [Streptomyces]|uniref:DUF4253 domain-containing protein n=1 Tax=Streptomyces ramulosus TaxID=47762 RepID=A0ABW1FIA6_9ACTN